MTGAAFINGAFSYSIVNRHRYLVVKAGTPVYNPALPFNLYATDIIIMTSACISHTEKMHYLAPFPAVRFNPDASKVSPGHRDMMRYFMWYSAFLEILVISSRDGCIVFNQPLLRMVLTGRRTTEIEINPDIVDGKVRKMTAGAGDTAMG